MSSSPSLLKQENRKLWVLRKVVLAAAVFFFGRHVSLGGFLRTWLPCLLVAGVLLLFHVL